MMMSKKKMFAEFKSNKNVEFDTIELCYSWLHWIGGNPPWFCRIWRKNWLDRISRYSKEFGESYGNNKFEAYRKALNDLGYNK